MLDIRLIREEPDVVRRACELRGVDVDIDRLRELDERRRALVTEVEQLRAERNAASKAIGEAKRRGEDAEQAMAAVRTLGERMATLEEDARQASDELDEAMLSVPNLVQPDVPAGGEDDAQVLREVGERPGFDFDVRDHLELGTALHALDMERAARASGSRFAYLLGDAVRVQFALVQLALDRLGAAGFTPVVPPVLVREEALWGTGFFPADRSQVYRIPEENHDLFLVGTSEVPLAALHMDEIIDAEELPLRYAGVSPCFRREAGAAGKDTRGIIRVHQFDKVEMFSFTTPEQSAAEHDLLLARQEELVQAVELPYRVVNIAAGDLGAPAAKKYDIEVWLPGQQAYRELTSTSNCLDYQARRLRARMRIDGKTQPVHTLNGTAYAIGRTLVAIMENGQQPDGTIRVPEALHQYGAPAVMGGERAATTVG